jgi:hypothetical protein
MPRSRSLTRLTMRVGLLHLGQLVDFVVSITFLRSPVFAIFAICRVFLLQGGCLCTHPPRRTASTARTCAASHRNRIAWKERDSLSSVYMNGASFDVSSAGRRPPGAKVVSRAPASKRALKQVLRQVSKRALP